MDAEKRKAEAMEQLEALKKQFHEIEATEKTYEEERQSQLKAKEETLRVSIKTMKQKMGFFLGACNFFCLFVLHLVSFVCEMK